MLKRRHILQGLASAAGIAVAGQATGSPQGAQECPLLIDMANGLDDLAKAHTAARDRVKAIAAEWGPQWPTPDEKIITFGTGSKVHRNILGAGVEVDRGKFSQVVNVGTPETFQRDLEYTLKVADRKRKTKSQRGLKSELIWAERHREAIEPSRIYWAEVERITALSGIKDAQRDVRDTRDALHTRVDAIMSYEEKTIHGLAIKAQAMQAWAVVAPIERITNLKSNDWADALAGSIVRHSV